MLNFDLMDRITDSLRGGVEPSTVYALYLAYFAAGNTVDADSVYEVYALWCDGAL